MRTFASPSWSNGMKSRGIPTACPNISADRKLEEICYETDMENLDMVLSGPFSPNPAELLEDELFKTMIESVKEIYDYIIIDTPPMANVIDGASLPANATGRSLSLKAGQSATVWSRK